MASISFFSALIILFLGSCSLSVFPFSFENSESSESIPQIELIQVLGDATTHLFSCFQPVFSDPSLLFAFPLSLGPIFS